MIRNSHFFVKRGALCGAVLAARGVSLPAQERRRSAPDGRQERGHRLSDRCRQIDTSNPDVVDVVLSTTREILVNRKAVGNATLIVWNRNNQRTFYNVNVELNLDPLRRC